MTTEMRALIAALEALTADALKSSDDATLDRLRDAAERLETLISDEQGRRCPTPDFDIAALEEQEERNREKRAKRVAERQARHKARRVTIREAIDYCATKPELHTRMRELFPAVDLEP